MKTHSDDERMLRDLVASCTLAFNRGDEDEWLTYWSDKAELSSGAIILRGHDGLRQLFRSRQPSSQYFTTDSETAITGEIATLQCNYFRVVSLPEGSKLDSHGRLNQQFCRTPDGWQIRHCTIDTGFSAIQ